MLGSHEGSLLFISFTYLLIPIVGFCWYGHVQCQLFCFKIIVLNNISVIDADFNDSCEDVRNIMFVSVVLFQRNCLGIRYCYTCCCSSGLSCHRCSFYPQGFCDGLHCFLSIRLDMVGSTCCRRGIYVQRCWVPCND